MFQVFELSIGLHSGVVRYQYPDIRSIGKTAAPLSPPGDVPLPDFIGVSPESQPAARPGVTVPPDAVISTFTVGENRETLPLVSIDRTAYSSVAGCWSTPDTRDLVGASTVALRVASGCLRNS